MKRSRELYEEGTNDVISYDLQEVSIFIYIYIFQLSVSLLLQPKKHYAVVESPSVEKNLRYVLLYSHI
jgi:hypothetical protein